jgi:hypothetical protein
MQQEAGIIMILSYHNGIGREMWRHWAVSLRSESLIFSSDQGARMSFTGQYFNPFSRQSSVVHRHNRTQNYATKKQLTDDKRYKW